jgi:hypothetical protein
VLVARGGNLLSYFGLSSTQIVICASFPGANFKASAMFFGTVSWLSLKIVTGVVYFFDFIFRQISMLNLSHREYKKGEIFCERKVFASAKMVLFLFAAALHRGDAYGRR